MKTRFISMSLVLALVVVACGSGDGGSGGPTNPGNGGGGGGTFTATIDGKAFKADANAIVVLDGGGPRQGLLFLSGGNSKQGVSISMIISFFTGPATQPLGVDPVLTPGGNAWVTTGSSSNPEFWTTPASGNAGSIAITVRTDKRIAGTFHFVGEPTVSPGPSTKTVTNGAFDITVDAGLPPLPAGFGSTASATIDGAAWNAAGTTAFLVPPSVIYPAGQIGFSAANTMYGISMLSLVVIAPGNTYGVPSQITLAAVTADGTEQWGASGGPDIGSVTITTLNAERIVGTFNAIVPPITGASTLTITNGVFDSYIGQ